MSGHHPWRELTKYFTAEDREVVEAGAAEIVADSDRRERLDRRRAGAASKPGNAHVARCRPANPLKTDQRSRP